MPGPREKLGLLYYGGKLAICDWVILNLPRHDVWIEICGGGASVTLNKGRSKVEIYNDIGYVSEFMEVLRDDTTGPELHRLLSLMPYSRDQFYRSSSYVQTKVKNFYAILNHFEADPKVQYMYFHEWCQNMPDRVLHAAHWYVTIFQGFTHEEMGKSWLVAKSLSQAQSFRNHVDSLPYMTKRMREIQIEHLSYERLIPMYDAHNALFYADPPYMDISRSNTGNYINEMTVEQHEILLDMLINAKGNAVISGYDSPLYSERLKDWRCLSQTHTLTIRNTETLKAGNLGQRTEKLWIKRSEGSGTLWEGGSHSDVSLLYPEGLSGQEAVLL